MKYLLIVTAALPLSLHAAEEVVWEGNFELGYVATDGNTQESSLKSRVDLKRLADPWEYQFRLDGFNASSEGDRSAEKYFTSNRLTYSFSEHNYLFGYSGYEDDRFSGFDYQATLAAGYGRRLLRLDNMRWDAEIGPGYRITRVDDETQGEEDSDEAVLRGFSSYRWDISDNAVFEQELSAERGSDNTLSKSITSLKSTIVGNLAMKLSYTVEYTENVPNDKKHADTETSVTIAYAF